VRDQKSQLAVLDEEMPAGLERQRGRQILAAGVDGFFSDGHVSCNAGLIWLLAA
jgi:hypothetical protein